LAAEPPALTALRQQRDNALIARSEAEARCQGLSASSAEWAAADQELKTSQARLAQINKTLARAQTLSSQKLSAAFQGEDQHFRTDLKPVPPVQGAKETDAEFARRKADHEREMESIRLGHELDWRTTKYFNEAERNAAKLTIGPDGTVQGHSQVNADGTMTGNVAPVDGSREFVLSPEAEMYQFSGRAQNAGDITDPKTGDQITKKVVTHHSSVLAGGDVAGAGEVTFKDGKITGISNKSGHYKPGVASTMQTVETLLQKGALLDQTLMMTDPATGKGKPLDDAAKALLARQAALQQEIARKQQQGQDMAADQRSLADVQRQLHDLGVAPANKISNAEVALVDGAEKKTGFGVIAAQAQKSTVDEFLKSGANNTAQFKRKQNMQAALVDQHNAKIKARLAEFAALVAGMDPAKVTDEQRRLRQLLADNREPSDNDVKAILTFLAANRKPQPKAATAVANPTPPQQAPAAAAIDPARAAVLAEAAQLRHNAADTQAWLERQGVAPATAAIIGRGWESLGNLLEHMPALGASMRAAINALPDVPLRSKLQQVMVARLTLAETVQARKAAEDQRVRQEQEQADAEARRKEAESAPLAKESDD
jgi:hypothetical protein